MEKISEESIRKQKIDEIKSKGRKEILERKMLLKQNISDFDNIEVIDKLIKEYYALIVLENYFNDETSMMQFEAKYYKEGTVIYTIPIKYLNIWLESGSIISKYLTFALSNDDFDGEAELIMPYLSDNIIGYGSRFITAIDSILYDEKHKEEN